MQGTIWVALLSFVRGGDGEAAAQIADNVRSRLKELSDSIQW